MHDPLQDVMEERRRQDGKWGVQRHGDFRWLAILVEEVGEASKALLEHNADAVRKEVTHACAVALAWLESIESKGRALDPTDERRFWVEMEGAVQVGPGARNADALRLLEEWREKDAAEAGVEEDEEEEEMRPEVEEAMADLQRRIDSGEEKMVPFDPDFDKNVAKGRCWLEKMGDRFQELRGSLGEVPLAEAGEGEPSLEEELETTRGRILHVLAKAYGMERLSNLDKMNVRRLEIALRNVDAALKDLRPGKDEGGGTKPLRSTWSEEAREDLRDVEGDGCQST